MNIRTYQNAKRYATKIKYNDPIDLVHDSYVKWYEKTGQDLFDEPEGRVMSILRNTFRGFLSKNRWTYDKRTQGQRQFYEFRGDVTEDSNLVHSHNPITPEDYYIAKELKERFVGVVATANPTVKEILNYRYLGYQNKEISEELGVSKSLITHYLKQVDLNGIRDI